VRAWQLRLSSKNENGIITPTYLETAEGARVSPRILAGIGTRHLILFATHGASVHWADGRYRDVLEGWTKTAAVALLQLLPQRRWRATALGTAQGVCQAKGPGLPTSLLDVRPFWWTLVDDSDRDRIGLPIIALDPHDFGIFAAMQMARGRSAPVVFLDQSRTTPRSSEIASTLATLRAESPEAYRLAIYLASSPFTLPVARLVQEFKFPSEPPHSMIADILLSGLVVARPPADDPNETYYEFYPEARRTLLHGLRRADATMIARRLEDELSQHCQPTWSHPQPVSS
jgi:hypothetical protein